MDAILTETVLDRKGCPLHYWVGGPEGRPLVVFTHGASVVIPNARHMAMLDNPQFFNQTLMAFLEKWAP
jgi:hypothetical protein